MSVRGTILLLLVLVALSFLGGMGMFGLNPFASAKNFVACTVLAILVAVAVVGGFSLIYGPPQITTF